MKYLAILAAITLFAGFSPASAQTKFGADNSVLKLMPRVSKAPYDFTVADFEKLSATNENDFETYVLNKGYSPDNNSSKANLKLYRSDANNTDGTKNVIMRSGYPGVQSFITQYTTLNKQYYLDFKQFLVSKGYSYSGSRDQTIEGRQATVLAYYAKPYYATIFSFNGDNGNVYYNVCMQKLPAVK